MSNNENSDAKEELFDWINNPTFDNTNMEFDKCRKDITKDIQGTSYHTVISNLAWIKGRTDIFGILWHFARIFKKTYACYFFNRPTLGIYAEKNIY